MTTLRAPRWLRVSILPALNLYLVTAFVLTQHHAVFSPRVEEWTATGLLFVPAVLQLALLALQVRWGSSGSSLPLWGTRTMPAIVACTLSLIASTFFTYDLGLIAAPSVRFWGHAIWSASFGVAAFIALVLLERREHQEHSGQTPSSLSSRPTS